MDTGAIVGNLIWVIVAVVAVVVTIYVQRKRHARLAQWATHRGWTYHRSLNSLAKRWGSPPFNTGRSRKATEVMTGVFHGEQALSFAYQYTTGGGKNQTTHRFHVVVLHLPAVLPWLQLSPENFGTSVSKFFGGQDITFESQAFNDAWRVQGPEGQFPFDFIHPRMMERLLQPDAVGRNITIEGQDIYVWTSGRQDEKAIDFYLNLLLGIIQQVPRHLWLRVGHDPQQRR